MTTRRWTTMGGLLVAAALVLAAALPAAAHGAAASGAVGAFADGPALGYQTVDGRAVLVRAAGQTVVSLQVRGLQPGATYASHVHERACADGDAGGHYRFDRVVPGGALDGTEIWPGPVTANAAGNAHGTTMVGAVAGADAVSVVVHAPSGHKIACADLR